MNLYVIIHLKRGAIYTHDSEGHRERVVLSIRNLDLDVPSPQTTRVNTPPTTDGFHRGVERARPGLDFNDRVRTPLTTCGFHRKVDDARLRLDLNCGVYTPLTTSGFHRKLEGVELASERRLARQG